MLLIDLATHLRDVQKHVDELGLRREETAFYDALAENGSAREAMQSDTLRLMARKLAEMVKKLPKLDWTQRESVRASLRRNVRRHGDVRVSVGSGRGRDAARPATSRAVDGKRGVARWLGSVAGGVAEACRRRRCVPVARVFLRWI